MLSIVAWTASSARKGIAEAPGARPGGRYRVRLLLRDHVEAREEERHRRLELLRHAAEVRERGSRGLSPAPSQEMTTSWGGVSPGPSFSGVGWFGCGPPSRQDPSLSADVVAAPSGTSYGPPGGAGSASPPSGDAREHVAPAQRRRGPDPQAAREQATAADPCHGDSFSAGGLTSSTTSRRWAVHAVSPYGKGPLPRRTARPTRLRTPRECAANPSAPRRGGPRLVPPGAPERRISAVGRDELLMRPDLGDGAVVDDATRSASWAV